MKLRSPAAARNAGPILDVLREWLPEHGRVLEIAAGSGEHALAFARALPSLQWQPSDPDRHAVASIATWRDEEGTPNLLEPLRLDVRDTPWPIAAAEAVLAVNMVHISPWAAGLALLDGAARLLPPGGPLILYGPWRVEGEPLAPSNLAFDTDLRSRDPEWGLREVQAYAAEARSRGLEWHGRRDMPANNLMLRFVRTG